MSSQGSTPAVLTEWLRVFRLQHVICGLYLYEWVTTLDYECHFYTRRRAWTWTFGPYLLCRYSALGALVNLLLELNNPPMLDCTTWARMELLLPYLGVLMASLLIAVRTIAIWNRQPAIVAVALMGVLTSLALVIHSIVISWGTWNSNIRSCYLPDSAPTSLSVLAATLAFDVLLLLLMLLGLFRRRTARRCAIWNFLWKQGLIWLAIALAAEVPTVIIIALDFSSSINQAFQAVGVVVIVLAATRMYRSLTDILLASRSNPPDCDESVKLAVLRRCPTRNLYTSCPPSGATEQPVEIEVRVEQEVV
ncbi:unnamed protein product [Peniophora sp. CBMAI 1063]|nr:unnamed protein product [Peniophora sp. CBMAI 1063]